jgi:hypothetical protein
MFSDYLFLVGHPVNRDDRRLLANAMASDFTVSKRTIGKGKKVERIDLSRT